VSVARKQKLKKYSRVLTSQRGPAQCEIESIWRTQLKSTGSKATYRSLKTHSSLLPESSISTGNSLQSCPLLGNYLTVRVRITDQPALGPASSMDIKIWKIKSSLDPHRYLTRSFKTNWQISVELKGDPYVLRNSVHKNMQIWRRIILNPYLQTVANRNSSRL